MGPEGKIQKHVIDYGKEKYGNDFVAIKQVKLKGYGTSGWPDYFVGYKGRPGFIEFKAPGEPATELQLQRHIELRRAGFVVVVIDDKITGRHWIDWFVSGNKRAKGSLWGPA